MEIELLQVGLTALAFFIGAVVHGIAGFGFAQVSMGLLPLFRGAATGSVVFSMVAIVANARVLWSVREYFRWRDWAIPVLGLAVGMPLGIRYFQQFGEEQLRFFIGATLLLAVILIIAMRQLSFARDWIEDSGFQPGWTWGVTAGFLAGILGGAIAIPGPPMIMYGTFMVGAGLWKGRRMKAVFTAFFGTVQLYRLASLLVAGSVTMPLVTEAALGLPGLFLGAWLGILIFRHISQDIFRWIVLALLTTNALILLLG
ncbi:MAG: sulfite exporter TauE/SafE family protein [Clostridia bacterium]